jgi:SAM-dependent methyltransferase
MVSPMPSDNDAGNVGFYDAFAEHFHLIFEDWDASMRRQGQVIVRLLQGPERGPILDVACGIGTQCLPLAAIGYSVEGSDVSVAAIKLIADETAKWAKVIKFRRHQAGVTLAMSAMGRSLPEMTRFANGPLVGSSPTSNGARNDPGDFDFATPSAAASGKSARG